MFAVALRLVFAKGADTISSRKCIQEVCERHSEIVDYNFDESQSKVVLFVEGTETTAMNDGNELRYSLQKNRLVNEATINLALAQSFERGTNILTSKATSLLAKHGKLYLIPVGLVSDLGPTNSARLSNALSKFGVKGWEESVKEAVERGLLERDGTEIHLTKAGQALTMNLEVTGGKMDTIDQVFHEDHGLVVRRDGTLDKVRLGHIFQQLMESGVGFEESLSIVRRAHLLFKSLEPISKEPIVTEEEVRDFVTSELTKLSSSGLLGRRFSLLTNLVSNDGGKLHRLTRRCVRELVDTEVGSCNLKATRKQVISMADDVFESLRRLTWGVERDEFVVSDSLLRDLVRSRVDNSPDVALVRTYGREQASRVLFDLARKQASKGIALMTEERAGRLPGGTVAQYLSISIESLLHGIILSRGFVPWGNLIQDAFLASELDPREPVWLFATKVRDNHRIFMSRSVDFAEASTLFSNIEQLADSLGGNSVDASDRGRNLNGSSEPG